MKYTSTAKNLLTSLTSKERHAFREGLFQSQRGLCCWCKSQMKLKSPGVAPDNEIATIEHLVDDWARPDGKDDSLDKLALAHARCNSDRNKLRHSAAMAFYKSKFENVAAFHTFTRGRKPRDLILQLGPWEFTSTRQNDTMNQLQQESHEQKSN